MEPEKIIQEMTRRLVEGFHPRKIILFGSHAANLATVSSDVDFLVIVPEISNRRALRVAMRRALNGLGMSKDIVVLSDAEFEIKRNIPGTIAYPADREGKILYAG
jgi:uncharacterized protein